MSGNSTTTCEFSRPKSGLGATSTSAGNPFQWEKSVCNTRVSPATTTLAGDIEFPQYYVDIFVFTSGFFLLMLGGILFVKIVRHLQ